MQSAADPGGILPLIIGMAALGLVGVGLAKFGPQGGRAKRKLGLLLAVLILVGLAVGDTAISAGPVMNNLIIGTNQEPSNLNPWEGSADTKENTLALLFLGLTYFDNAGVLRPGLATEVPTEANGRVRICRDANGNFVSQEVDWTIRSDAKWSDGTDITCDDAVFTFAVQDRNDLPISTHAFSDLVESVECNSGAGGKDFTITYDQPNLFFTSVAGSIGLSRFGDIAPKHIWESVVAASSAPEDFLGADAATGSYPSWVVGSGAFQFVEWNLGQFMTMDRRVDFILNPYDVANYVGEVTIRFIGDQNTLLSALFSGELDATDDIGLAGQDPTVLQGQLGSSAVVEVTPSGFIEKLNFNLFEDPNGLKGAFPDQVNCQASADLLLYDKRTRQAIIQAIDREALLTVFPGAIISNSFIVGGDIGFNADLNTWPYDPSTASALLLEDLGWADTDGNGVLDRTTSDGRKVEFRLPWVSTTAGFRVQTGQVLQQQLAEIGIALDAQSLPASTLFSSEYLNRGAECTWSGIVEYAEAGGLGQAPADPLSSELYANDLLESPADPEPENAPLALNGYAGTNITGWDNPTIDQMRAEALWEFDMDARAAIVEQMQVIYNDELPTVPLYERTEIIAKKTGLLNFKKGTPVARTQFVAAWCWGWEQNGAVEAVC
ncbi:MAG: peptide ABC transporter substrate-binding protein [Candidatus Aenigmarchaeota archaeon]|nr:peptide ABC transporter substrate-binding protein [Candidatus Aenigmarchaeota archaeon]